MASTDPLTMEKSAVKLAAPSGGSTNDYAHDPYPERKRRADRYFDDHLGKQRNWYSKNAGKSKRRTNFLAFVVLACGAATTVIQLFEGHAWLPLTTAILGTLVVLTKGLESIGNYQENWLGFRKASEGMKREYRLFINNAGDYADAESEDEAYRWFVEAVEKVIAEEQNQFWEGRGRRHEAEGGEGTDSSSGQ
jgi:hypothetical protein